MATSSRKHGPVSGQNVNSSNFLSHQKSSSSGHSTKKVLTKHSGSLEIIEGDASDLYSPENSCSESGSRPPSQAFQRPWSRSSMGSVPPRPDSSLSRRMATPTKQISLQAVKRKEESSEPFLPDVDFAALNLDKSYSRAWDLGIYDENDSSRVSTPKYDSEAEMYAPQHATQLRLPRLHESEELVDHRIELTENSRAESLLAGPSHTTLVAASSNRIQEDRNAENTHPFPSTEHIIEAQNEEGEDDDEEEEDSDEEERKAPNELLIEFVECLMKKDYKNAEKLCKMILLYEPSNPEALKFQPVIEEKLRLDAEAEADEEEEEEDDEEDEDDDADDDDNDEDDDDDSSSGDEDDDSDEDDNEESIFRVMAEAVAANYYANQEPGQNVEPSRRRDSGIASDSEQ